jgi:hypothetical protein
MGIEDKYKKKHLQVRVRYPVCGVRASESANECNSVSAIDTLHNLSLSPPFPSAKELSGAALWPTGRGWLSAQRGHIPLGLKEGCALARPLE